MRFVSLTTFPLYYNVFKLFTSKKKNGIGRKKTVLALKIAVGIWTRLGDILRICLCLCCVVAAFPSYMVAYSKQERYVAVGCCWKSCSWFFFCILFVQTKQSCLGVDEDGLAKSFNCNTTLGVYVTILLVWLDYNIRL